MSSSRAHSEAGEFGFVDCGSGRRAARRLGTGELQQAQPADNYLERIAKYVPGEVIAFFIFINAILEQAARAGGKAAGHGRRPGHLGFARRARHRHRAHAAVRVVRTRGRRRLAPNAFVSTLAFPFWAYALGATAFNDYWDGNLAAILLATFSVVSGLISPRAKRPKRAASRASNPARTERPHLDLVEPSPA